MDVIEERGGHQTDGSREGQAEQSGRVGQAVPGPVHRGDDEERAGARGDGGGDGEENEGVARPAHLRVTVCSPHLSLVRKTSK